MTRKLASGHAFRAFCQAVLRTASGSRTPSASEDPRFGSQLAALSTHAISRYLALPFLIWLTPRGWDLYRESGQARIAWSTTRSSSARVAPVAALTAIP